MLCRGHRLASLLRAGRFWGSGKQQHPYHVTQSAYVVSPTIVLITMGLISSLVADVRRRGATGFQVRIELLAKSRLRDHFLVAWIVCQLARAESREGAVMSFHAALSRPFSMLFVWPARFYGRCSPGNCQHKESPSADR